MYACFALPYLNILTGDLTSVPPGQHRRKEDLICLQLWLVCRLSIPVRIKTGMAFTASRLQQKWICTCRPQCAKYQQKMRQPY